MRNVFANVGPRGKQELAPAVKAIVAQPSLACAQEHLQAFRLRYEASYPEAVMCLMRDIDQCLTFSSLAAGLVVRCPHDQCPGGTVSPYPAPHG